MASDPAELVGRVQELAAELESIADPAVRRTADELVAALVQMYGSGLERVVEAMAEAGPEGRELLDGLAEDPVVASLLLIHDLHPVPLEQRVREALDRVRPYMESHGGDVELLDVTDGVARLRLQGSCRSCSASSSTLELAVRQALEEAAPDLEGMDVEGVDESGGAGTALPMAAAPGPATSWFAVDGIGALAAEQLAGAEVAGTRLVIANVEGTLLAYRDTCASCGGPLDRGELSAGALTCPACGRSFFLPRAGRSLDDERLQLDPVPLLRENGSVKVALPA
jgi:Fe-S cluster biogenesis protein NfuA/nitrite reductase/ring-hydroxylating ferredoxin subunit